MIIRQEESTPIGNCFHDSGLMKVFEKLKDTVDKFEVDTDDIQTYCDDMIASLKTLKSVTSKAETEYQKLKARKELRDTINNHY
jgi:hypothetical protein